MIKLNWTDDPVFPRLKVAEVPAQDHNGLGKYRLFAQTRNSY